MRKISPTKAGARLGMPVDAWPPLDRKAWAEAFEPSDLLDGRPRGVLLRLPTRIAMETCYARWLAQLKRHDPDALNLPPAARATRERVHAYAKALLRELTKRTVYGYVARLKRALELIEPDGDRSWMTPLLGSLEHKARAEGGTRDKLIVPTDKLVAFGTRLMKDAEAAEELGDVQRAEAYRDGLMIAFLALRPLRLKNMLQLEIGTTFLVGDTGIGVDLEGRDMKNWMPLEFQVPIKLLPQFRRYLSHHREILAGGSHGAAAGHLDQANILWLARSGRRFPTASFEDMVSKRTLQHFGIRLTPHGFRHCAATFIVEHNPEDFHVVRIILGHSTIATAEKYYIKARGSQAFRMAQGNVNALRDEPTSRPSGKRPVHPDAASMLFSGHTDTYKRGFAR